ncbi:phage head closure protein [Bacillus idriensis]|uniref:Phage head closure protein n=1 Tax=Metabacillus idriensis TaxID=324768 RepID=A0A6I2MC29_9BACI|nr:phage head closure protein [Metabacillus idriensis]MRX54842.1 phage head closure protein [Metabacillus idriensis]
MMQDIYPHFVTFQSLLKLSDGAGGYTQSWADVIVDVPAFCDTPSSRELFQAQQLNTPFDRNLYYEYRTDINEKMRCIFEGEAYELIAKPQDQGGQNEVMKVQLRLMQDGR